MSRVGMAADHGGFALKEQLAWNLREAGYEVSDFGEEKVSGTFSAKRPTGSFGEKVPDTFSSPLARAVARGEVARGICICGSGVGASVAANKIAGVRAALVHEIFSAHQGVEDDDMNVICLGGRVIGAALAWGLVKAFLAARFTGAERHRRRLAKVAALEKGEAAV